MTTRIVLGVLVVFIVIHVVPFAVYGLATAMNAVQPLEQETTQSFFLGVVIEKFGLALTFVLLFYYARGVLHGRWLLYGSIWWLLFVFGEIGTAIRGGFAWPEAIAGILSETIYLPIAAFLTNRLVGRQP